jgi:hypothetical protein
MRGIRAGLLGLLAASSLAIAALPAAPAAEAAPDKGTIHVTVFDENGDPMTGAIWVFASDGGAYYATTLADYTTSVHPGSYGVMSLSPWGGMLCAGLDPCDYTAIFETGTGVAPTDGTVQVVSGQTTEVSLHAVYPVTLLGQGLVGKPLRVKLSDDMQRLLDNAPSIFGPDMTPTVTWSRDGTTIVGADDFDYTPTAKDVGHDVAAVLSYDGLARSQWQRTTDGSVPDRPAGKIHVTGVPTKAYVTLPHASIEAGQRGGVRVEVTAPNAIVTGKVTLSVGSWKVTQPLRNGTARARLPLLAPGSYAVHASYRGDGIYNSSTAKPKTLTVKR